MIDPNDIFPAPKKVWELFGFMKHSVERWVEDKPEGVVPMVGVMAISPFTGQIDNTLYMLAGMDFDSELGKKKAMRYIAAKVYRSHRFPIVVGHTSEAWMANLEKGGWEEHRKKYLLIADRPDKVEVAVVSALGFHKPTEKPTAYMDTRKLARDAQQRVLWDGDWLNPAVEGAEVHCSILEQIFEGFVRFAMKADDPDNYLGMAYAQEFAR